MVIVIPVSVIAAAAVTALLTVVDAGDPKNQIELIKTGLTVGAGTGGVVALVITGRRQWATEHDSTERRLTELYLKAVDQLGSDKAAVRQGGLYALERVAQDNPSQRQTVVNVLCGYLRAPFYIPEAPSKRKSRGIHRPLAPNATARKSAGSGGQQNVTIGELNELQRQEEQVRLTAERILGSHLQPGIDDTYPRGDFWAKIDLDLAGATFSELDLTNCLINKARFDDATFNNLARFDGAKFMDGAKFTRAKFTARAEFGGAIFANEVDFESSDFKADAEFTNATFKHLANFESATFAGNARFDGVTFKARASFERSKFAADAEFVGVDFEATAGFGGARFERAAGFDGTTFRRVSWFDGVKFSGNAEFGRTNFEGTARFDGAKFGGYTKYTGANFVGIAWFKDAIFTQGATLDSAIFQNIAGFECANFKKRTSFAQVEFTRTARFDGVKFAASVTFNDAKFLENAKFMAATFAGTVNFQSAILAGAADFEGSYMQSSDRTRPSYSWLANWSPSENQALPRTGEAGLWTLIVEHPSNVQ